MENASLAGIAQALRRRGFEADVVATAAEAAELGSSTDKLHARGPMGLEELTTYKYVVTGDGVVR